MKDTILIWARMTLITIAILLGGRGVQAQVLSPNPNYYIHTFNNLYQLNPAMAGSNDELTGFLTYHQQVISGFDDAPRHISLSADAPFTKSQLVAFGGNIYTFRRSILQSAGMSGTFARKLILGKKTHTLRLGVTGGFFYNTINPDGVNLADPAIARLNGKLQPDVSFGLNYQLKNFQFGLSFPKLLSFATVKTEGEDGYTSALRVSPFSSQLFYFLYDFEVNEKWTVRPMLLYRSFSDAFSGMEFNTRLLYADKVWVGGTWRNGFGGAAFVGYKAKKLSVSYAYKMANAQQYNYANPAHEIQLGVYLGRVGKKKKVYGRGGARLDTKDTFVASRTKKSKQPEKKKAPAKGSTASKGNTPKEIPAKVKAKSGKQPENTAGKVWLETVRKGESSSDMNSGNYLVVNSYSEVEEAQKELLRQKYGTHDGVKNDAKIGYNSEKKLYYVYIESGSLEEMMKKGNELRTKKGFEKISVLKITNRPHEESLK